MHTKVARRQWRGQLLLLPLEVGTSMPGSIEHVQGSSHTDVLPLSRS